jgi:site-specific recombinase XerD
MTLENGLAAFLDAMLGKNRSSATLRAYRTDVLQFITFLHPTLSRCSTRKNRLSSAECVTTSTRFRGDAQNGIDPC